MVFHKEHDFTKHTSRPNTKYNLNKTWKIWIRIGIEMKVGVSPRGI